MPVVIPVRVVLCLITITNRPSKLLWPSLRNRLKLERCVLHLAKRMTAVCGLRLLYFCVKPVQKNHASFTAGCVHNKRSIAPDTRTGPALARGLLPH